MPGNSLAEDVFATEERLRSTQLITYCLADRYFPQRNICIKAWW